MRHEIACGELEVGKQTIGQRCLLEKVAWETYWSTNWFVSSYKPTHAQQCLQPQDIQNIRQCQFRWQKNKPVKLLRLGNNLIVSYPSDRNQHGIVIQRRRLDDHFGGGGST